jgi:hypothetical protein
MKMKKSELRQMIREVLREELRKQTYDNRKFVAKLKEKLDLDELATRGNRDKDDELLYTDLLYLKDIYELADYCSQCYGSAGGGGYTMQDFRTYVVEDSDIERTAWVDKLLNNAISQTDALLLRDAKIGDPDAFAQLKSVMEALHDNSDNDFWSFYESAVIYDFITDGKRLYMRVDMSPDEIEKVLTGDMSSSDSWDFDYE